ncbi:hypothetical protein JCM16303_000121 [Sporobolomyces ruberrimus]
MATKVLYLTRHAQAEHNVANDNSIPDARLTQLGRKQSAKLRKDTEGGWTDDCELLVSSPLRRPMQTLVIGYAPLRECLEKGGKAVILLPELQEVNSYPCDRGSTRETLESDPEFAGLDFSHLEDATALHGGNHWTSKQGFFSTLRAAERARWVRNWLRDRKENKIVVVAHGDILRFLVDGYNSDPPWANAEVRAFIFKRDDDDAVLTFVGEVVVEGENDPTSSGVKN